MIPDSFSPPRLVVLRNCALEVLSPRFADADFAAVKASAESIRHTFGPNNDWPDSAMSYQENLADLTRHALEFERREAFAYAVLDRTRADYWGCLYLKPIKSKRGRDRRHDLFAAQAFLWLSVLHRQTVDAEIQSQIDAWFTGAWPLESVAWPGRRPGWAEWATLAQAPSSAQPPAH